MSVEDDVIRVTKGDPTPDEIAALVTALTQKARAAGDDDGHTRPSTWAAYWRSVRTPLRPGPDAWRISGLPHS